MRVNQSGSAKQQFTHSMGGGPESAYSRAEAEFGGEQKLLEIFFNKFFFKDKWN